MASLLALQARALQGLQNLGLPLEPSEGSVLRPRPRPSGNPVPPSRLSLAARQSVSWRSTAIEGQKLSLKVPHRSQPLPLALWPANAGSPALPWVLLLPGLGGDIDQLSWLAGALAH